MNTKHYFLGWFLNQDGKRYCSVYSERIPIEIRKYIESKHDSNDIYNQIEFCSQEYFEQCVKEGWAEVI